MPRCTLAAALLVLSACGGEDGRESSGGVTAVTGATIGGVSETGVTTGAGTEPGTGDTGVAASTGSEPGGTTQVSTYDSDSFPQTSAVSWDSSGFGESAEPECEHVLRAMVRDFKEDHPDFESDDGGTDPGIVLPDLGPDNKPVYAGEADNPTTHGQAAFDQWYRDVADVNIPFPLDIALNDDGNGKYTYDNSAFFPIDDQGWGNQGNSHNYHFTLELHTVFKYSGGEVFKFRGDDDLFVFINKKLAIDLGGVHGPQEFEVMLDAQAAALGITPGNQYQLDFFFAERHTSESNFRIETTIACLAPPG